VREFEEADLRTYRISFVVKRSPKAGLYGSIIIREEAKNLYVIAHTRDFNPNTKEVVIYQKGILREQLSKHLIALCDRFYTEQTNTAQPDKPVRKSELKSEQKQAHQCSCCLTIYDEAYGDQQNGVEPGSPFESLDYYSCPVCESGKDKFNTVLMAIAISN
jgi:rubredoxin